MEIEAKVRIKDYVCMKALIATRMGDGLEIDKHDIYFYSKATDRSIRIRNENHGAGFRTLVTTKSKQVCDGIEVNDEIEFAVDSADTFERFLRTLGYERHYEKEKVGWAWERKCNKGEIHYELMQVGPLGWFLEIEIICDPNDVEDAQRELVGVFSDLGYSECDLERRPYKQLLSEVENVKA
jgi:adenylate cyclase class 2